MHCFAVSCLIYTGSPRGTTCLLHARAKRSYATLTIDSSLFTGPFTLAIRTYWISFPLQDSNSSLGLCEELGLDIVMLN